MTHWQELFSSEMLIYVWGPALTISICHYATPIEQHWLHDIYRRLYYLPIVAAGLQRGIWGGLAASLTVSFVYMPHAFYHLTVHDPGHGLEKLLEILLYNFVGALCGELVDREERRIHQQRRAEQQLFRAERLAALGELVAGIAHEVKNPLHTLKGTAEIIDSVVPAESQQAELWKLHREELMRLERVADKFLDFARPRKPRIFAVSISEILSRTQELLQAGARQAKVTLEIALPEKRCLVAADPDLLIQVLIDIGINGFRSMNSAKTEKRLHISAACSASNGRKVTIISMRNTGPKIPERDLERIFDPFYTTHKEGSGLGLSTAARIMEQHLGTIEVRNLPGDQGVVFDVSVPQFDKGAVPQRP